MVIQEPEESRRDRERRMRVPVIVETTHWHMSLSEIYCTVPVSCNNFIRKQSLWHHIDEWLGLRDIFPSTCSLNVTVVLFQVQECNL